MTRHQAFRRSRVNMVYGDTRPRSHAQNMAKKSGPEGVSPPRGLCHPIDRMARSSSTAPSPTDPLKGGRAMSMSPENPPSEWSNATQIGSSDVYVSLGDTPGETIVWHWCPTLDRWEGAYISLHTIVTREPLTITASLHRPDCCGWHGFITNGQWIAA